MTNNTNEVDGTTFKAYAPIVDCVKVTTEAVLIWDENHNEPATGNYHGTRTITSRRRATTRSNP